MSTLDDGLPMPFVYLMFFNFYLFYAIVTTFSIFYLVFLINIFFQQKYNKEVTMSIF